MAVAPARRGRAGEDWRPEAHEARTLLGEADALAAAGRFSEAAHRDQVRSAPHCTAVSGGHGDRITLFRSIEDVDERLPELIRGHFSGQLVTC